MCLDLGCFVRVGFMVVEIPVRRFLPEITVSLSVKTEKDQKEKSTRAMHGLLMLAIGSTGLMGMGQKKFNSPVVMGEESMMSEKGHGTYHQPVQQDLRWGCSHQIADNICNFNRHYAERAGYFERSTRFLKEEGKAGGKVEFYDSNTGFRLFRAPVDRSWEDFIRESRVHGWPSFRDAEVDWDHVRVLPNGECISKEGTHLGHNLPDSSGNRYCINVSQATVFVRFLSCAILNLICQSFDSHAFLPPKARKRGWSS